MMAFWGGFLAIFLPFLLQQGIVQDQVQAQYFEAMASAASEGLPALVRRLDAIAVASPSSPFNPYLQETIQSIGLLHPGSVPDQAARLKVLKAQSGSNPGLAKVVQRIEILEAYYQAAKRGHPDSANAALADPAFEGSQLGLQAMADAALRARDYGRAEAMAQQVIEADPYSPLLANAHMIMGLSATFRGDAKSAVRHFQQALAVSSLATLYGNTQDYLFTAYRFSRPAAGAAGELFDEVATVRLAIPAGLKDPQSLIVTERGFLLIDKEQALAITPEGKVLETMAARRIADVASPSPGKVYYLAEDGIDLGSGSFAALSLSVDGKTRAVKKLRSLTVDDRGDIYLLDQDFGLLRGSVSSAGVLTLTSLSPTRGRLIRIDWRGNLYVLSADGRSVLILSREGTQLTSVLPAPTLGKEAAIEYVALDSLNHLYVLDGNSIQIFAMNEGSAGLDKQRILAITLDARPQFKNLRVLGVTASGELVATGKNEETWVCYR